MPHGDEPNGYACMPHGDELPLHAAWHGDELRWHAAWPGVTSDPGMG